MSNEYYRPTYSLDEKADDNPRNGTTVPKAYNPTEVRLYGLKGPIPDANNKISGLIADLEVSVNLEKSQSKTEKGSSEEVKLLKFYGNAIGIASEDKDQTVLLVSVNLSKEKYLEAGIIFAYAYEGHCYDLPKPKVMLIPATGKDPNPDDCGFDKKPNYKVWVVDKLERCIEIEVSQGFVEQLVLSANMPGNRSPSTYRATMAMSHRSGRLTDS